jgi:hypothetical protein
MNLFFGDGINMFGTMLWLAGLAGSIVAIVDAAPRPDAQWAIAQQNKVLWISLLAAGAVLSCCFGLGLIMAAVYWFAIRPKLETAKAGGAPGGEPMPPPPPPPVGT